MPITDSKPTSDNPQTQAPQNVQYAAPYPQQFEDDTIDLKIGINPNIPINIAASNILTHSIIY